MNTESWIKHINQWKEFLSLQIALAEDEGLMIKAARQLKAIEMVRYSAVLNPSVLISFISPQTVSQQVCDVPDFFLSLNTSQQSAVKAALGDNSITLIQGPPGTGKTQVITELCLQLYRQNPNVRILVCSETHVAVNNLISRIASRDKSIRILRIRDKEQDNTVDKYSTKAIVESYSKWLADTYSNDYLLSIFSEALEDADDPSLEKSLALSANVVGMTCNRVGAYDFGTASEMFDVAIIDEVCKATLPEILMPLIVAQKAVLVGDPKQLPPVFCSEDLDIVRNIEKCDLQKYMYIDNLFTEWPNVCVLDTQYRMSNEIGNLIGELFYAGMLRNGRNVSIANSIQLIDYTPSRSWPVFVEEDGDKQKIFNLDECDIISNVLLSMDEKLEDHVASIAVITPYKYQAAKIKAFVRSLPLNYLSVEVDTVDGFQGKECDCVLFSLTRTKGPLRFLSDTRRLNVALSRARDRIIIVGNIKYAAENKVLKCIVEKSDVHHMTLSR